MASTKQSRLTEAHRGAQVSLAALVLREVLALWSLLNPRRVDATSAVWKSHVVSVIQLRRQQSRALSVDYYRLLRAMETGRTVTADIDAPHPDTETIADLAEDFRRDALDMGADADDLDVLDDLAQDLTVVPVDDIDWPDELDTKAADTSLEVTGPIKVKQDTHVSVTDTNDYTDPNRVTVLDSNDYEALAERARAASAAAAERHVQNAGRDVLDNAVRSDKEAIGWIRVTDGSPCAFCAMLASRGIKVQAGKEVPGVLYRTKESASTTIREGVASKYHDHCHCTVRPVFMGSPDELPDLNREFAALWPKVTAKYNGEAKLTAWRKYLREHGNP